MRTVLSLCALIYSSSALSYESEPENVLFSDTYELLNVAQFDTGWLPSQVPFGVRFYIQPTGGIVTDVPATGNVMWPQSLEHGFQGYNGLGVFGIDTSLEMAAQVNIDISIYQDTFDLWSETLEVEKLTTFDGLLLPGSVQESVDIEISDKTLIPPIEIELPIIVGVDLVFTLEIYPEFTAEMSGEQIDTVHEGGIATVTSEAATAILDLPSAEPGLLSIASIYSGFLNGNLNLILKPTASLDTIIGDFDIVTFELPVNLLAIGDSRAFEPVEMLHPLPVLEASIASHNFGELLVGESASVDVTILNVGELEAVGEFMIDGSADFTLSQDFIAINPGKSAGVTVTYTPTIAGGETGMLVLFSNDPARPELTIPLGGDGVEPVDSSNFDPTSVGGGKQTLQTCGCSAQSLAPLSGFAWLPLFGFLGLRRREV